MTIVDKILDKIAFCIENNIYEALESQYIELKDASHEGEWRAIHKSVNAFLNTEGGIIILGIKESPDQKSYKFTGYNEQNQEKVKNLAKGFTDGEKRPLDVEIYLKFQTVDFLDGRVCVIYVESLPVDLKYIYYKEEAYERILASVGRISEVKIINQNEIKDNLILSRELQIVENATINDLDVDKLNEYIHKLNEDIKVESIKADIHAATHFLERKKFTINGQVSTLGMLVCGKDIAYFLGSRCQIDCYVDSLIEVEVASDKKILKDNILPLMQKGIAFIYKNIQVGISPINGGQAIPEYPEKLIRESVNNALAHRDYSVDKYINIIIKPNVSIEIRNAGAFKKNLLVEHHKHEVPIRRIIPDVKRRNPLLTEILKVYDKYEGRGIGMSVLTNECLANKIDLPYYKFHVDNEMSLVIRKGKLLDEGMELIFENYRGFILKLTNGNELTNEHKLVLSYLIKSEIENNNYRYTIALTPDNNHLQAIRQLKVWNLVEEHPLSEAQVPIFIVHRQLLQANFTNELQTIFGSTYTNLATDYKECLNIIYQCSYFSAAQSISASATSNFLFIKRHGTVQNHQLKEFDNFKRKVRKIFENLATKGFIVKQGSNQQWSINDIQE